MEKIDSICRAGTVIVAAAAAYLAKGSILLGIVVLIASSIFMLATGEEG